MPGQSLGESGRQSRCYVRTQLARKDLPRLFLLLEQTGTLGVSGTRTAPAWSCYLGCSGVLCWGPQGRKQSSQALKKTRGEAAGKPLEALMLPLSLQVTQLQQVYTDRRQCLHRTITSAVPVCGKERGNGKSTGRKEEGLGGLRGEVECRRLGEVRALQPSDCRTRAEKGSFLPSLCLSHPAWTPCHLRLNVTTFGIKSCLRAMGWNLGMV